MNNLSLYHIFLFALQYSVSLPKKMKERMKKISSLSMLHILSISLLFILLLVDGSAAASSCFTQQGESYTNSTDIVPLQQHVIGRKRWLFDGIFDPQHHYYRVRRRDFQGDPSSYQSTL